MRIRHLGAALALFITLGSSHAFSQQQQPESLLSEDSVVYLRFDGLKTHQEGLRKTVVGQLLAEDLHPLAEYLKKLALDASGPDVVAERLLQGAEPGRLIEIQKAAKLMPPLLENVLQRGLVVGVELNSMPLPGAQVTLVFPGAGSNAKYRDQVFAAVRLLALRNDRAADEQEVADRTMLKVAYGGPTLACWSEGDHVLATFGTARPEQVVKRIIGDGKNLTSNPLFLSVSQFDEYETFARVFVDSKRGINFVRGIFPPAAGVLDEIGLSGVTSLTLHAGCEDELLRNTLVLNTPGERKGILAALTASNDLKVSELPPLPPDTSAMAAVSMDAGSVYAASTSLLGIMVRTADPGQYEEFKSELQKFEKKLGGDVRRQLDEAIESTGVIYTAPSEGAMFMGTGLVFKVKDADKLQAALKRLFETIGEYGGAPVNIRQQPYRDGKLNVVDFQSAASPFTAVYAIHKGWFAIGLTPQAAQGLILRSGDEFSKWHPGAIMKRGVADFEKRRAKSGADSKVLAMTHIDPRPTVSTILSYTSLVLAYARAQTFGNEGFDFDPTLIPNAQAITERLSPGSAMVVDEGSSIRIDTRDTLPLPLDISGIGGSFLAPALFFRF